MRYSSFQARGWNSYGKGNKMIDVKLSTEDAESLQNYVTDHINRCLNDINGDENIDDDWEPYDLFCGCDTCSTREYLMSTFDWLRKFKGLDVYVGD